jgi:hypothetical protein
MAHCRTWQPQRRRRPKARRVQNDDNIPPVAQTGCGDQRRGNALAQLKTPPLTISKYSTQKV